MNSKLEAISKRLATLLEGRDFSVHEHVGELTLVIQRADMLSVMRQLRDDFNLNFEQLIDVCGVDYQSYGDGAWQGKRFASVYHLLSVNKNHRLRVRVFAEDDDFPVVDSVIDIWPAANWFEREAFDLRRSSGFAPHSDRLRFRRPSLPQRFPAEWLCRNALRPRSKARGVSTRFHRRARDHSTLHTRR